MKSVQNFSCIFAILLLLVLASPLGYHLIDYPRCFKLYLCNENVPYQKMSIFLEHSSKLILE